MNSLHHIHISQQRYYEQQHPMRVSLQTRSTYVEHHISQSSHHGIIELIMCNQTIQHGQASTARNTGRIRIFYVLSYVTHAQKRFDFLCNIRWRTIERFHAHTNRIVISFQRIYLCRQIWKFRAYRPSQRIRPLMHVRLQPFHRSLRSHIIERHLLRASKKCIG